MRRQLTTKERKYLQEIEDAAFAINETGRLMTNDIAAYRFFNDIGDRFGIDEDTFLNLRRQYETLKDPVLKQQALDELQTYAQVPTDKIFGTDIPKFGHKLQGKYIPKDILRDITIQRAVSKDI